MRQLATTSPPPPVLSSRQQCHTRSVGVRALTAVARAGLLFVVVTSGTLVLALSAVAAHQREGARERSPDRLSVPMTRTT